MAGRSLINLEAGVVEGKIISQQLAISSYHDTLKFVIKLAEMRIREELKLVIDDRLVDRKERQLLLLKQAQYIEFYKEEIENCEMAIEDAHSRMDQHAIKELR